jgi:hypothetical protein
VQYLGETVNTLDKTVSSSSCVCAKRRQQHQSVFCVMDNIYGTSLWTVVLCLFILASSASLVNGKCVHVWEGWSEMGGDCRLTVYACL